VLIGTQKARNRHQEKGVAEKVLTEYSLFIVLLARNQLVAMLLKQDFVRDMSLSWNIPANFVGGRSYF